jgi:hypothetical protein
VRFNHAKRIRIWIEGNHNSELGAAESSVTELSEILAGLHPEFRSDLALVCESHNLDDLDDCDKYKLAKAYGNSDAETANLQYCAIILRTSDLLQFHKQRAPSTLYRLINPTDPLSQAEWARQNAVRRIRAKPGVDSEGNVSESAPRSTIEVTAKFVNESGYFGLTSYLRYAGEQLRKSYAIIEKSKKASERKYDFPWRLIDDSNVEAEGFIPKTFGFELDQAKILDLLTGHTLYNNSKVVIRELVQNAIDAIRLQAIIDKVPPEDFGKIVVTWSSEKAELQIDDNGTGMSQAIIENHLLKVGSSRYQDPTFREKYATFSPISRFGIGVLSAFMVADSVEIVTCALDEDYARQISLRSVHGRYLVRLLHKKDSPEASELSPHGTRVKLKFRASVKRIDVLEAIRLYVYFPRCEVKVIIDNGDPIVVGYSSPRDALEKHLTTLSVANAWLRNSKVEERRIGGITLAYALRYDDHYRDWNLIGVSEDDVLADRGGWKPIGTCIEGIAVEFATPGFTNRVFLAVANFTGPAAPKTNVARSAIEDNSEKLDAAKRVNELYSQHIVDEVDRLQKDEGYSLTYATSQIPFLIGSLRRGWTDREGHHFDIVAKIPLILVEDTVGRKAVNLNQLVDIGQFWIAESQLFRSIEDLIKQTSGYVTTRGIVAPNNPPDRELPSGSVVMNAGSTGLASEVIRRQFEIAELKAVRKARRIDSRWVLMKRRWVSVQDIVEQIARMGGREAEIARYLSGGNGGPRRRPNINIPIEEIAVSELEEYVAVVVLGELYLTPATPLSKLLTSMWRTAENRPSSLLRLLVFSEAVAGSVNMRWVDVKQTSWTIERHIKHLEASFPGDVDKAELISAIEQCGSKFRVFNPFSWERREGED